MGTLDFVFGVEMEMLITRKAGGPKFSSREKLLEHLALMLTSDGIQAYIKEANEPLSRGQNWWAITSDSSLQEEDGVCKSTSFVLYKYTIVLPPSSPHFSKVQI